MVRRSSRGHELGQGLVVEDDRSWHEIVHFWGSSTQAAEAVFKLRTSETAFNGDVKEPFTSVA